MDFSVTHIKERRLSLKIIAGKIRARSPNLLYPLIIKARYHSFPANCGESSFVKLSYSDGSWTTRKTTKDLRNIEAFLSPHTDPIKVLQIGVGNSSLYKNIRHRTSKFVGITVVEDEVDFAKQSFPDEYGSKYKVTVCNKYSSRLVTLGVGFDYIVDNDISSYACCKKHFNDMLEAYSRMLSKNGKILIGFNGLGYFDSGFGMTMRMAERVFEKHNLRFEKRESFYIAYLCSHTD